jgi:wyosine [tRNA(Phe)-imidazoG37] synthetase (radical SAM superfamily)
MLALHWNVVYGPVQSRRLGVSLGVNLLPPDRKVCTFNCPYCQYGWSQLEASGKLPSAAEWPSRKQIVRAV